VKACNLWRDEGCSEQATLTDSASDHELQGLEFGRIAGGTALQCHSLRARSLVLSGLVK
jgi:hypothetical protein